MSTVPAAIDAILAAVRTALPTVQVWDGPPVGDEQDDRVVIGWSRGRPTTTVARDDETFEQTTGITERYYIPGAAISYSGDPDLKPRRDRAYALAETVAGAVATDAGIAALDATATLTQGNLTQEKVSTGVQAIVDFTIEVVALLLQAERVSAIQLGLDEERRLRCILAATSPRPVLASPAGLVIFRDDRGDLRPALAVLQDPPPLPVDQVRQITYTARPLVHTRESNALAAGPPGPVALPL